VALELLSDLSILTVPVQKASEGNVNVINLSFSPIQVEIRVQGAPLFTAKDIRDALQAIKLKNNRVWTCRQVKIDTLGSLTHYLATDITVRQSQTKCRFASNA
jgi:hypothetical protein